MQEKYEKYTGKLWFCVVLAYDCQVLIDDAGCFLLFVLGRPQ